MNCIVKYSQHLFRSKEFIKKFQSAQFSNLLESRLNEIEVDFLLGKQEGIAIIKLNKPSSKNALNNCLVGNLSCAVAEIAKNNSIRVVILRSLVPGIFCAGADLKERLKLPEDEVAKFVTSIRCLFKEIEQLPMPVIAAIDGAALGGGLEMALACDIRTTATNAKLGLVETRLAIIPGAGGTQRLPRILSPALAKELIFTARILSGKEAKELGIVNHVCEQNTNRDAAYQRALQIAEEIIPNGPIGVRMAKKAIDKGIQFDIETGCAIEEACYAQIIPTKDRLEGLNAFSEKRKPQYTGN